MSPIKLMQRTNLSRLLFLFLLMTGCSDDGGEKNNSAGGGTGGTGGTGATGATGATGGDANMGGETSGGSSNALSGSMEVVTFWGNTDLAAIENAADAFMQENADVSVKVTAVEGGWAGLDDSLDARLAKALPMPEVFQRASDDALLRWNAAGEIADLTSLYAEKEPEAEGGKAWQDVIPKTLLATHRYGEQYLSIGVNLHRTNSIFYNKRLFEENDLSLPKTIEEFKDLVVKISSDVDLDGGAPLVIGNLYNWPFLVFVFTCLGPHVMGPDEYTSYFSGESNPENAKFEELLELALFLRCGPNPTNECAGYFNADMDLIDHVPSIDAFIAGYEDGNPKYAMTQAGDWVKQWMKDGGLEPGVDFDAFACPVAEEGDPSVFTGGVDAFSMTSRAPNPEAGVAFMKFLGSKAGQLAINEKKGAIPVRNDINLADYPDVFDAIQVKTYADFQEQPYFRTDWKPGALPSAGEELRTSLQAGTIDIAYNYVKNNYSTLK